MATINTDHDSVTCSIAEMSRDQIKREILHFKKGSFKLDFSEDYLDGLTLDQLRHILLAARLQRGSSN